MQRSIEIERFVSTVCTHRGFVYNKRHFSTVCTHRSFVYNKRHCSRTEDMFSTCLPSLDEIRSHRNVRLNSACPVCSLAEHGTSLPQNDDKKKIGSISERDQWSRVCQTGLITVDTINVFELSGLAYFSSKIGFLNWFLFVYNDFFYTNSPHTRKNWMSSRSVFLMILVVT